MIDLQIEQGEVTVVPATYTMCPKLKFTEAQKNNDEKKYSTKDFYDACAKAVASTAAVGDGIADDTSALRAAQPVSRG